MYIRVQSTQDLLQVEYIDQVKPGIVLIIISNIIFLKNNKDVGMEKSTETRHHS